MTSLFLDTSNRLTYGVLNEEYQWLTYCETEEKKSSTQIHKFIYDALRNLSLDIQDLNEVFAVAGPGSYTGMRVAEGINQIFELDGIQVYSFYHFQVPALLDVKKGLWIANAFKGDLFVYNWNEQKDKREIIKQSDLEDFLGSLYGGDDDKKSLFSGHDDFSNLIFQKTSQLIQNNSEQLFKKVKMSSLREEVYYFRPLLDEFKVPKRR